MAVWSRGTSGFPEFNATDESMITILGIILQDSLNHNKEFLTYVVT
jgi:hypothetical protein